MRGDSTAVMEVRRQNGDSGIMLNRLRKKQLIRRQAARCCRSCVQEANDQRADGSQ